MSDLKKLTEEAEARGEKRATERILERVDAIAYAYFCKTEELAKESVDSKWREWIDKRVSHVIDLHNSGDYSELKRKLDLNQRQAGKSSFESLLWGYFAELGHYHPSGEVPRGSHRKWLGDHLHPSPEEKAADAEKVRYQEVMLPLFQRRALGVRDE